MIRQLVVAPVTHFRFGDEVRALADPDGPPTGKQLLRLWHLGAVALVEPAQVEPPTKGECAAALGLLLGEESSAEPESEARFSSGRVDDVESEPVYRVRSRSS